MKQDNWQRYHDLDRPMWTDEGAHIDLDKPADYDARRYRSWIGAALFGLAFWTIVAGIGWHVAPSVHHMFTHQ